MSVNNIPSISAILKRVYKEKNKEETPTKKRPKFNNIKNMLTNITGRK